MLEARGNDARSRETASSPDRELEPGVGRVGEGTTRGAQTVNRAPGFALLDRLLALPQAGSDEAAQINGLADRARAELAALPDPLSSEERAAYVEASACVRQAIDLQQAAMLGQLNPRARRDGAPVPSLVRNGLGRDLISRRAAARVQIDLKHEHVVRELDRACDAALADRMRSIDQVFAAEAARWLERMDSQELARAGRYQASRGSGAFPETSTERADAQIRAVHQVAEAYRASARQLTQQALAEVRGHADALGQAMSHELNQFRETNRVTLTIWREQQRRLVENAHSEEDVASALHGAEQGSSGFLGALHGHLSRWQESGSDQLVRGLRGHLDELDHEMCATMERQAEAAAANVGTSWRDAAHWLLPVGVGVATGVLAPELIAAVVGGAFLRAGGWLLASVLLGGAAGAVIQVGSNLIDGAPEGVLHGVWDAARMGMGYGAGAAVAGHLGAVFFGGLYGSIIAQALAFGAYEIQELGRIDLEDVYRGGVVALAVALARALLLRRGVLLPPRTYPTHAEEQDAPQTTERARVRAANQEAWARAQAQAEAAARARGERAASDRASTGTGLTRSQALAILDLPEAATPLEIRARWISIHGRDQAAAGRGDAAANQRLVQANLAYETLTPRPY
jgi:hypothetical protein